jgi:hypothetical protein
VRVWWLLLGLLLASTAHAQYAEVPGPSRIPTSIEELPPWPGPLPASFPSAEAYSAALQARLLDVNLRERGLQALGRPPSARARRLAGWLTMGGGFTMAYAFWAVAMAETERDTARLFAAASAVSALVAVGGFVLLLSAPRNVYRKEIGALAREGKNLERELQRVKWERVQTQLNLSHLGAALTVRF